MEKKEAARALREAAAGGDFAAMYAAALAADEDALPEALALVAASGKGFRHARKTGQPLAAEESEALQNWRAEVSDAGALDQEPNAAFSQTEADLILWASRVAEGFAGNGASAEDLAQEACVGVSEAFASRHACKEAAHFPRYVRAWCEWRVLSFLAEEPDWVLIPHEEAKSIAPVLAARDHLAAHGNAAPTAAQIAEASGKTEDEVAQALAALAEAARNS